ncbi:MAG: InlB B-repeat-containing protein, partial [Clostridia bacterium]|nr:InlB B-repeat-containing protein [Clostridia bacterium]
YNQNEELVSEETVINRSIILFAKWSPLSNTVTFDANEGTVNETERTVLSGNQIGMLPIPERENYVFLGWYEQDDVNFENPILVTSVVTGDMALIAKWESNDILKIVIFLPNEGIISENEIVRYVTKDNEIGTLPVPKRAGYNFEGWYYSNGEKASSADTVADNTILIANWVNYITTPCINGGTNHTWSMWDYSAIEPTCTEDGKAMRFCYDCGGREYRVGSEKLGHDYIAGWTYDVMQQSRVCARCTMEQVIYYTSLSDKINKTTITGNVLGAENVDCLYNYIWDETTGTFCGKGGSVAVDIEFTEATGADYVYIKGQGGYTYTVSVLYEGDSEYTLIGAGSFGENAIRFNINGKITNARIHMENGGSGNGYWQEIAFAEIPDIS